MSSDALAALLQSLLEGIATLPARTAERCPVAAARLQQLALAVGHRLAVQEMSPSEQQPLPAPPDPICQGARAVAG